MSQSSSGLANSASAAWRSSADRDTACTGSRRNRSDHLRLTLLAGALAFQGWVGAGLSGLMSAPAGQPTRQEGAAWEVRRLLAQVALVKAHAVLHAGIEEREGDDSDANHEREAVVHASEGVVLGDGAARPPSAGPSAIPAAAGATPVSPLPLVLKRWSVGSRPPRAQAAGGGGHSVATDGAHAEEAPDAHVAPLNGAATGGRLPCGCPVDSASAHRAEANTHPAHAGHRAAPTPPTQTGHARHAGEVVRNREAAAAPAPTERNAGAKTEPGHEDFHVHSHTLAIPSRREDFRGILGDLERSVKPYLNDRGEFYSKDSDQTLPMYRVAAALDPQLIAAYTLGASFLYRAGKYPDAALAFLLEGERNNPSSFEIQVELGHIYLVGKKDYAGAAVHLLRARELAPRDLSHLTPTEQGSLADLYRWLALTYREWQRPGQALTVAREGLRLLGEDGTLSRIVRLQGR